LSEAEDAYAKAVNSLESVVADFGDVIALARAHFNLALLSNDRGKQDQRVKSYRRSIDILERLVADPPSVSSYKHALAGVIQGYATVLREQHQWLEAERYFAEPSPFSRGCSPSQKHSRSTASSSPVLFRILQM